MKSSSNFAPRFFSSLVQSCYNVDFYRRVKDIPLRKSIFFLFYLSLSVALVSLLSILMILNRLDLSQENIVDYYNQYVPTFQASFSDGKLSTEPSSFVFSFYIDEDGDLVIRDSISSYTQLLISIDTSQSIAEATSVDSLSAGLYVFNDGIYVTDGFQQSISKYSEMGYNLPNSKFNKNQLGLLVKAFAPNVISWLWKWGTVGGSIFAFVYVFFGAWILALVFSLVGVAALLLTKKKLDYSFLMKLSFYSMIPAALIWIITMSLSMTVPFLPLFIYAAFYSYGLSIYKSYNR